MATRTISNSDDIIDSRDVIARIEELNDVEIDIASPSSSRAKMKPLGEVLDEMDNIAQKLQKGLASMPVEVFVNEFVQERAAAGDKNAKRYLKLQEAVDGDCDAEELIALRGLAEDGESNASEWTDGVPLIRESYFVEYCEDLAKDIGDMPQDIPYYIKIDWDKTADNLKVDYSECDFDGVTYYVRS